MFCTWRMATSFLNWLSCLVGKRILSMTLMATSLPVFLCFPLRSEKMTVGYRKNSIFHFGCIQQGRECQENYCYPHTNHFSHTVYKKSVASDPIKPITMHFNFFYHSLSILRKFECPNCRSVPCFQHTLSVLMDKCEHAHPLYLMKKTLVFTGWAVQLLPFRAAQKRRLVQVHSIFDLNLGVHHCTTNLCFSSGALGILQVDKSSTSMFIW